MHKVITLVQYFVEMQKSEKDIPDVSFGLYLTLIRPILTYGAETLAATENVLQKLLIFERKILRKIYGPVKDRDIWRIRTN
jgi:hypothetical protein